MAAPWARGAVVRIVGKIHGQETVNVLHLATNTVVDDGPNLDQLLQQLVVAIAQCVVTVLLPAVSSDWTFVGVDGRIIYPAPGPTMQTTDGAGQHGALSPSSHSITSTLVRIQTAVGGRSGKGRWFLPPPGEAEIANSAIDAPTVALVAAFLACLAGKFIAPGNSEPWVLGVLSRKGAGRGTLPFDTNFHEATTMTPSTVCSYKGSRQIGRGV
jgi:hypothetical protein